MRETAGYAPAILTTVLALLACLMAVRGVVTARRHPEARPVTSNNSNLWVALALVFAIAVSIAPIFGFWYSGRSTGNAIGGLLPWNDALHYFDCSHGILNDRALTEFCQRRPIYSLFLATLTAIGGWDLPIVLLMQGALLGAAAFLLARVVQSQLDAPAALVAFAVLLGMIGQHGITTMTESVGLLYGIFGVFFLWRGAGTGNTAAVAAGVFLLTLGLNARAGAFFILPALLIWTAVAAREQRRARVIMTAAAIVAILGGFLFNHAALLSFGGDPRLAHSNFSYTLYGITVGGKSWVQVYADHPGIFTEGGGTAVTTKKVYAAAIDNVLQRPHLFVWGYLRGIAHYVYAQFRYLEFLPLRLLFAGLYWLGVVTAIRGWRDRHLSLLVTMAAGVIVSAPFITWDGGNRIYAATLPVDALIVANGLFAAQRFFLRRSPRREPPPLAQHLPYRAMAVLSAVVLAATFPGPFVLRQWTALSPVSGQSCEDGRTPIVIRSGLESPFLRIAPSGATSFFPLNVPADGFRRGMPGDMHLGASLARLPVDTVLLWGYQLHERDFGNRYKLVWENGTPPAKGKIMRFCIKEERHDDLTGFFVVISAQPLTD